MVNLSGFFVSMDNLIFVSYVLFFLVALLYSSAGFGGGSLYIALLTFTSIHYQWIPVIALSCNVVVVLGNCIHHIRNQSFSLLDVFPFIIFSIPAAYLGGQMLLNRDVLYFILGLALLCAGSMLVLQGLKKGRLFTIANKKLPKPLDLGFNIGLGGGIGYLSGMVGIGGGIFLSPILHFFGRLSARQITAISSFYILVNSLSGLLGQITKLNEFSSNTSIVQCIPFVLAVFAGGFIGNKISFKWLKTKQIKLLTGLVIFIAGMRLLLV